jgi:dihydroneopterin aldolase
MLFGLVLEEYCRWSGDLEVGKELFDFALYQMELMERFFENGLFIGENDPYKDWFFVDHDLELDRQAAMQAHAIVGYRSLAKLAAQIGRNDDIEFLENKVAELSKVAREKFYNTRTGLVESGKNKQISYASQIWMILAGVLNPNEGKKALLAVENDPSALKPSSPYMFHYLLEAWQICGDEEHLMELLTEYYGGMVKHGADTFWEVYRPDEPFFSPYNDVRMNSACHAWSGTASYFIRKGYLS